MKLMRFCVILSLVTACGQSQAVPVANPSTNSATDPGLSNAAKPGTTAAPTGPAATGTTPDASAGVAANAGASQTRVDASLATDDGLLALLRDLGLGEVQLLEPGAIRFRMEGQVIALFRDADNDLQLYYGVSSVRCPYEQVNAWNKEHRFSRAYMDDQSDMVLEADVLANGGLSRANVAAFVTTFRVSMIAYAQHLIANCTTATP